MEFSKDVQSLITEHLLPNVMDNVLSSHPITVRAMRNAKNYASITTGKSVRLKKTRSGGSFSALDEFDTGVSETKERAKFDPRYYHKSVVLQGQDIDVNASMKSAAPLIAEAMEEAMEDMKEEIATLLYGDGTGNGGKDFLGLAAGIDNGGSVATYGGISRATYDSWKGKVTNLGGALTSDAMAAMYSSVESGNNKPTIMLTTPAIWDAFEALHTATLEHNRVNFVGAKGGVKPMELVGDLGFEALTFRGTPIIKDELHPSGEITFLNEKYYAFYSMKSAVPEWKNIKMSKAKYLEGTPNPVSGDFSVAWRPLKSAEKQYAALGFIVLGGNYITFAPRRHGRLTGITT